MRFSTHNISVHLWQIWCQGMPSADLMNSSDLLLTVLLHFSMNIITLRPPPTHLLLQSGLAWLAPLYFRGQGESAHIKEDCFLCENVSMYWNLLTPRKAGVSWVVILEKWLKIPTSWWLPWQIAPVGGGEGGWGGRRPSDRLRSHPSGIPLSLCPFVPLTLNECVRTKIWSKETNDVNERPCKRTCKRMKIEMPGVGRPLLGPANIY